MNLSDQIDRLTHITEKDELERFNKRLMRLYIPILATHMLKEHEIKERFMKLVIEGGRP